MTYTTHSARIRLLYKTILRLHRGMPAELQSLGNNYARDEFKRHKTCNQTEANIFMVEWTKYAVQLSQQLGLGVRGRPKNYVGEHLDVDDLNKFADDQIVQLYELMKVTTQQTTDDFNDNKNIDDTPNENVSDTSLDNSKNPKS